MTSPVEFVRDLRRRKVFRGVGFYVVGAWSIVQVADVIAEPIGFPAWTVNALLWIAVVGFPVATWVAWRYELAEGRLVRTKPASAVEVAAEDLALKFSDYLVLAAMLAMVGFVAWRGLDTIRLQSEAETAPTVAAPTTIEAADNTIAVLPFSDLSPNSDHAYLADGVSDTVLHVLSRVPGLRVTSRTSSFAFRDQALTAAQIAAALGVAHILEGSVQRAGDQVRVIARVVDARSNLEIWTDNFDRDVASIFAIQDEIAESVAAALKASVIDEGQETVARYQPNIEAFEQYILGRRELERETVDGARSAVAYMERAVELDPEYALAHVGLHDALGYLAGVDRRERQAYDERGWPLIDRALELDPTLAEAWVARGGQLASRKDFPAAREATARALELNENLPEAWAALWNQRLFEGDKEGQLAAIRKAIELAPTSVRYQQTLATTLWSLARAEEAMAILRDNIAAHPENPSNYMMLARWLTQYGQPGEGMRYFQALRQRDPDNLSLWKVTCEQFVQFWDFPGARECYEGLLAVDPDNLDARKWLIGIVGGADGLSPEELREVIAIGDREIEAQPNFWYPKVQLADYLLEAGEYDRVIDLLSSPFPELLGPEPQLNDLTQWPARLLGEALWKAGRREEGNVLLDAVLAWVERSRKLQAGGWMAGIEDAIIHCIRDEVDTCIDLLGQAADRGWLFYSFGVTTLSAFENVREDPRFEAVVRQIEANAHAQRDHYYAHIDDPVI